MAISNSNGELPEFGTFRELSDLVDGHQDVLTIKMGQLRHAGGFGRLDDGPCQRIHEELRGVGLSHFPELTRNQEDQVRVYRSSGPMANLIDAVARPGPERDEYLRQLAGGEEAKLLQRIRDILA